MDAPARALHSLRIIGALIFGIALLNACGQSHSASTALIPASPGGPAFAAALRTAASGTDVVAINAGGSATGSFGADADYAATGTWTYAATNPIDTSGVTNPAPQAVYDVEREGRSIAYTIPNLKPGAAYTVRLSFAELYWTAAGKRVFNVAVNGANVLTNFDIYRTTGARFKAVAESFTATATSTGTIAVSFTAVTDNASVVALEIAAAPTTAFINAGGSATGSFSADTDYAANGTWTSSTSKAIATPNVTAPAPQAVWQNQRNGATLTYTVPGLTPGGAYTVRLDFAETFWSTKGQRVFNAAINGSSVLSNFDIYAAAGGANIGVTRSFNATATANGTIAIVVTAVTNYAALAGIEIAPGGSSTPTPTPTPAAFNDYATFGYDNGRNVFNPNSTAIAPAALGQLHLAWQANVGGGDYNTQTQPILATGIAGHAGLLFVGGGRGAVYAYDALSGALVWTTKIGQETYNLCGGGGTTYFGIGGTVAYDASSKSLYVVGNTNPSINAFASNSLYHLDAATGHVLGQVDFVPSAAGASELDFSHTSVALRNGVAYVGTGSTCDISSWRGRVAAINVPAMTLANTFFTVWDPNNTRGGGSAPWGGGGIWGWGGVAIDANGNVLTGVGNTDNGLSNGSIRAPFVKAPQEYSGYGETLLELSSSLTTVVAANHPIPLGTYSSTSDDLDVQGTPLVFQPNGAGCGTMVALQGKSGELTIYNEGAIASGSAAQFQLSPSTHGGGYLGEPAFSPATGLMYADVEASTSPTLFAPGLIAINPGCGHPSVAWHAAFGADSSATGTARSVPSVSAGGVIFAGSVNGTGGQLWALDASTGSVLNGGAPILATSGHLRMPATIDGKWVFIIDNSGNMYGLTIDPAYTAIKPTFRASDARLHESWYGPSGRPGP